MPVAQFKQGVDQLIKGGTQLTGYDADICAEIVKGVRQLILNVPNWVLISEHQITMLSPLKTCDQPFEVRQVFASPF